MIQLFVLLPIIYFSGNSFLSTLASLSLEYAGNYHDRTRIFTWQTATAAAMLLLIFGLFIRVTSGNIPLPFEHSNESIYYRLSAVIPSLIVLTIGFISFKLLREPPYRDITCKQPAKTGLIGHFVTPFENKHFCLLSIIQCCVVFFTVFASRFSYYLTIYYAQKSDLAQVSYTYSLLDEFSSLALVILAPTIVYTMIRFDQDKKTSLRMLLVAILVVHLAASFLIVPNLVIGISFFLILSKTLLGAISIIIWSILADITSLDSKDSSIYRAGAFNASFFILTSLTAYLGGLLTQLLMRVSNFDLHSPDELGPLKFMKLMILVIPSVGFICGIVLLRFLKIRREFIEKNDHKSISDPTWGLLLIG